MLQRIKERIPDSIVWYIGALVDRKEIGEERIVVGETIPEDVRARANQRRINEHHRVRLQVRRKIQFDNLLKLRLQKHREVPDEVLLNNLVKEESKNKCDREIEIEQAAEVVTILV